MRFLACVLLGFPALIIGLNVRAQSSEQANQPANPGSTTTVHGIVHIGTSGEPLPRALVRINGDASTGVLTDGEGRFEIADVPDGPQSFQVIKPGYLDHEETGADALSENPHSYAHNVIVAPQMGDLVFAMERVNSIQGQIQLSTGDVAEGITVTLLRRTVQDGRVVWQSDLNAKTNSDGVYRFGELSDGSYAVYTEPTMDSDAATSLVETGSGNKVAREGYASVFYPDARDLAGAAKIHVAGGESAQANIALTLESFQSVTATVTKPKVRSASDENVSIQVMDAQSRPLPYTAQYDASTHTVQASLPDGTYSFLALLQTNEIHVLSARGGELVNLTAVNSRASRGETSFAVMGHAVSNLRIPMSEMRGNPIQVTVERGTNGSSSSEDPRIFVTLSQTGGGLADGMVGSFAEGTIGAPLETQNPPPGAYWVHTSIAPKVLCEASFTAGGASLAREPLVLGIAGTTSPLVLALRDDCAKLTLSLPGSVGLSAGEERFYTVYAVPDFESTEDVVPQTLRPSSGGKITLTGLTPGNYHVYTFDRPMALEYRNPAALASLPGQAVTLTPGAEAELTVEVPQR
ncbi:MAG: carboxypeptidase-like regulatory domain-containing protein [Terracidiphilus sp.]